LGNLAIKVKQKGERCSKFKIFEEEHDICRACISRGQNSEFLAEMKKRPSRNFVKSPCYSKVVNSLLLVPQLPY